MLRTVSDFLHNYFAIESVATQRLVDMQSRELQGMDDPKVQINVLGARIIEHFWREMRQEFIDSLTEHTTCDKIMYAFAKKVELRAVNSSKDEYYTTLTRLLQEYEQYTHTYIQKLGYNIDREQKTALEYVLSGVGTGATVMIQLLEIFIKKGGDSTNDGMMKGTQSLVFLLSTNHVEIFRRLQHVLNKPGTEDNTVCFDEEKFIINDIGVLEIKSDVFCNNVLQDIKENIILLLTPDRKRTKCPALFARFHGPKKVNVIKDMHELIIQWQKNKIKSVEG